MGRSRKARVRGWLLALVVLSLGASGCVSVKSYVDPELPKVGYTDLLARREGRPIHLALEFQRNGEPKASLSGRVQGKVNKILQTSQLFSAVETGNAENMDRLQLVLNNVGDVGGAVGKGIKTGLTFGLAGSMVTDGYVLTATFTPVGGSPVQKVYKHALHSTVGVKDGPPGLTPMSVQEAFDKVLEELVLNLILDLQKEERL